MARNISIGIVVLILIALFIFPSLSLNKDFRSLSSTVETAYNAAYDENWKQAEAAFSQLDKEFEHVNVKMKFFIDHEDVDKAQESLDCARASLQLKEKGEFMLNLTRFLSTLEYMTNIERMRFADFL